ncbi:MAG: LPS export ABC transporter periplasmic protein LptC [Deltaproteobacteria bacterium]|nr:LPS export ABC transporter periplasmic protein LptC [Deltaproteobacteria bacterium]
MNRKLRVSLSSFIALSVAGLAVLVFIHYRTKNIYKITLTEDKKFGVRIDRVHYSGTKDGRLEWVLDADSAKRSRDEDLLVLDAVKLTFYSRDGKEYLLTAREGNYRESTGEVAVNGNVVVDSASNGYRLTAETLNYSLKTKMVTSDVRVRITSKDMAVDGVGLSGEIDKEKFRLLKDVHAVF